jgi:formyltetrahydrofolate deformylase
MTSPKPNAQRRTPVPTARPRYVLTLSCPDKIGIVAAVSAYFVERGCNILESAQFGDPDNRTFFYRTSFEPQADATLADMRAGFAPLAERFAMIANFYDLDVRTPTILMVSKFGHCLNDLLFRWRYGGLPIDVKAIVSNHEDFRPLAEGAGIPYHYLPVTPDTKDAQERSLLDMIGRDGVELVVLARYMQVLSPALCKALAGRVINIHHSFLPSFKGARPYHSAHDRGVKLIGATAHYVTVDLDEGPIIEQEVQRVHHGMSVGDYIAVGRDVEAIALGRAVKWHAERRILINGARTIVFA